MLLAVITIIQQYDMMSIFPRNAKGFRTRSRQIPPALGVLCAISVYLDQINHVIRIASISCCFLHVQGSKWSYICGILLIKFGKVTLTVCTIIVFYSWYLCTKVIDRLVKAWGNWIQFPSVLGWFYSIVTYMYITTPSCIKRESN